MGTFDEGLSEDGKRRAQLLRQSLRTTSDYIRPDPPPPGKVECFDDCLRGNSEWARAHELRQKCKAQIYWEQATTDEKIAIRDAVAQAEPYRGNEIYTRHFVAKELDDLIKVDHVIFFIIKSVLAL